VLAEPGELVGVEGLLELGRVDRMYAIAEVYETEISRVRAGQQATVTSDALPGMLTGTVRFIRPKVQKQDEIGTDPAARKDARIVEVGVLLEESEAAARLSNLQVEVLIDATDPDR
jgi:HlyD family secretion protein